MRIAALLSTIACAALVVACGTSTTTPTTASTTTPTVIAPDLFSGTLSAQGSIFYSFLATQAGTLKVTLGGLTTSSGSVSPAIVGIGLGSPSGIGCALATSIKTGVGLTPQLTTTIAAGTYCVQIFDAGSVGDPVNFAIRIVHPEGTAPTAASATTDTYTSTLPPLASGSRTFVASVAGQVAITLQSLGPPSNVVAALGLGIPNFDGTGCMLANLVNTAAGSSAQITATVDAGTYCVKISDIGNFTAPIFFTIGIAHP